MIYYIIIQYIIYYNSNNGVFTEGMLSIRARNPPNQDIVDVLRKFKVSFNVLVSSFS